MKKINKRGQVTLFVIIGAIILLTVTLIFFVSKQVTKDNPGIKEPEVSLEARPAMELIKNCLEQTAQEGLVKVGMQGGALTVLPTLATPSYRGEAVESPPYIIPFWRYLKDCSNPSGCEGSLQYPLCSPTNKDCVGVLVGDDSIQEQLEDYVKENIGTCINNFKGISQVYTLELLSEPKVQVYFGSGKTTFKLSYPTKISSHSSGDIKIVDDYIASFDVDLLGMYNFAEEIINFEREYNYYERETMNLVSAYSGIDASLPPTGEMQLSAKESIWTQPKVKETLQYDLLPFMNFVRFANTQNGDRLYQKEDLGNYTLFAQGIYDGLFPKTSNTMYPYDVTHQYTYDDIFASIGAGEMIIRPSDVLQGSPLKDFIGSVLPGIKDYRFSYAISYPLIIKIFDPDALNGEGYTFQFAVEVNVRNNVPAYQNFTAVDYTSPLDSSLADYEVRPAQNITIATFDKRTGKPLENVLISYVCGEEFTLGQTTRIGEKAELTTTMPYCELGGYIKYEADGYLGESFAYNNKIDNPDQYFEFDLWPLVEKEIIIKRRVMENSSYASLGTNTIFSYTSLVENLTANQTVYFNMKRTPQTPYDENVPKLSFLNYRIAPPIPATFEDQVTAVKDAFNQGLINKSMYDRTVQSLQESAGLTADYAVEIPKHYYMDLAPGNYSVKAYIIDNSHIYIPNETITVDNPFWEFWKKNEIINLPSLNLSSWPSGGAILNFTLTPAMLYTVDRSLTFYVLEQPLPKNWDDMQSYQEPEKYQVGKENFIQPSI